MQPTDKKEIANIISSLNCNKASSPSNIPYRVLFLLKIIPWNFQAIGIFIQPLFHGVFPSVLKTPKLAVFKQDSKLDYFNYFPISPVIKYRKNTSKILCTKDCIPSSITIILSNLTVWIQATIFYISCLN